jgi:hypothetical protein
LILPLSLKVFNGCELSIHKRPKNRLLLFRLRRKVISSFLKLKRFNFISASSFSSYFATQLSLPLKLKNRQFRLLGLQRGILSIVHRYFNAKNKG